MCELATVIFCLVKMKRVCLKSNFSDNLILRLHFTPGVYRMTAQIREKIRLGKYAQDSTKDSTCLNVSMRFGQRKMGT